MDPSKPKPKLSFGLNKLALPRLPLKSSTSKGKLSKPLSTFKDDDDEDEEPLIQPPIASTSKGTGMSTSRLSKQQRLKQQQELELDKSAYEYDEVYDQMKSAEKNAQAKLKEESTDRKPKYIAKLVQSSELRKQDRLRAEDKMIAKEREREGDEFKDKDQFVTPGYLKQQEEMRRVEQEEKRKEEANAGKKGGMLSFYKQYLDTTSATHEAAVLASQQQQPTASSSSSSSSFTIQAPPTEKEKSDLELAKEFEEKSGKKVEVNDDGEIMDKRQLMSGGLNIVKKKLGPQLPGSGGGGFSLPISARQESGRKEGEEEESTGNLLHPGQSAEERRRAMRERQSREIERQMVELEKKRKRDQEESDKGRVEKVQKRRNDETKVEELKRKAEERRKKREEEMKNAKE